MSPESSMSISLSVLICTFNRHELLEKSLDALLNRTNERPSQVVVVNGGDERADRVVRSYQASGRPEVVLVKTVNKNLATSRNIGLPHCDGDIIAMTDDDAEVFPDWVTRMKEAHMMHPEAGCVGGLVIGTDTGSTTGKVADLITFPSWREARFVRTLPGVNVSYKRDALQKVGSQDEELFRGEDVDFNWRLQKLGFKILYSPDVRVYHHHRPTFRGLLNQQYMYGRAYYLVRRKYPDMYSIYPHGINTLWDIAKLFGCVASAFYEPIRGALRLGRILDRLVAYPMLLALEVSWRAGMFYQATNSRRGSAKMGAGTVQEGT